MNIPVPPPKTGDYRLDHAIAEVQKSDGVILDITGKAKRLNKFGKNDTVGTAFETVAIMQGTESNETFVSTNLIDGISSSDETNDVGITFTIEGHTIDASGNLTFVIQNVTLHATDARTEVALTTPLARCTRAYVANSGTFDSPQAVPTGNIYIYDNTGGVAATGIPNTATQTKTMIEAGETQTEKCSTTVSKDDYWFLTKFEVGVGQGGGSAGEVQFRIEARDVANGGVWRPNGPNVSVIVGQGNPGFIQLDPVRIIPKNHDVRIVARSDANTCAVYASMAGYLANIMSFDS